MWLRGWGLKFEHRFTSKIARARTLEQTGYLRIVNILIAKAGSEKAVYNLTAKSYLALKLDSNNIEELLNRMDENTILEILAAIARLV